MWPAFLGGAFWWSIAIPWPVGHPQIDRDVSQASMQWLVHARKMGVGQRLCPCCSLWRKVAIRPMWWVTCHGWPGWVSWGPGGSRFPMTKPSLVLSWFHALKVLEVPSVRAMWLATGKQHWGSWYACKRRRLGFFDDFCGCVAAWIAMILKTIDSPRCCPTSCASAELCCPCVGCRQLPWAFGAWPWACWNKCTWQGWQWMSLGCNFEDLK